ncbi:unnamed protein product [Mycena citricolor]|uniref:Pyrroloquinoline quinone-dependent pyranose dehydrogenase beta-propeller domain-containing protein n=1 Tax=Mycena citricolor TaxID=2018698 RepID=A0AAD2HTK0_9AGAR|nr:unnamed protein product [Mycena citricolor]
MHACLLSISLVLVLLLTPIAATFQPSGAPFRAPVTVAPGFSAQVLFSNLTLPRGIALDGDDNILVVERGLGVSVISPAAGGWDRTLVIANPNFTQGIQLDADTDTLYVSTAAAVLAYQYDHARKSVGNSTAPCDVILGLPADGDLTTHTLQLEKTPGGAASLLVANGPLNNIDPTARDPASGRSQIRRFALSANPCRGSRPPKQWTDGRVVAYGIRNPAGFAVHPAHPRKLYVVENGASIDNVTGLTPAFVNDNPADEINAVHLGRPAVSYGFPDCTTLWNPTADPAGDPQYTALARGAQISLMLTPDRNDSWCASAQNNVPPVLSLQAHSVPLDIKFYAPHAISTAASFPASFAGDAVVSFHGSFNRNPPTGYGVVHAPFPFRGDSYEFLVQASNLTSCPGHCIRPVGLAFSSTGVLYVSSDTSGEVRINFRAFSVCVLRICQLFSIQRS